MSGIIDFSHIAGREPEDGETRLTAHEAKWKHSGIYAMVVEGKVIYVGKSKDMSVRLYQHMFQPTKAKKYEIINQFIAAGHSVGFVVVEYCAESALKDHEAYWINYYLPPLNYQIPEHPDFEKQKSLLSSVNDYKDALELAKVR